MFFWEIKNYDEDWWNFMISCESLDELKEWLEEDYTVKGRHLFKNQRQTVAYIMNEYEYLLKEEKTQKNCIIILLGKLIIDNDKVIDEYQYDLTLRAINETIEDYKNFSLNANEKQEIYDTARLIKEKIHELDIDFN